MLLFDCELHIASVKKSFGTKKSEKNLIDYTFACPFQIHVETRKALEHN